MFRKRKKEISFGIYQFILTSILPQDVMGQKVLLRGNIKNLIDESFNVNKDKTMQFQLEHCNIDVKIHLNEALWIL